jgi:GNAT superfamily N-acetyltransferase
MPSNFLPVPSDQLSLFCDTNLAERVERAEAQLIAEAGRVASRRRCEGDGFVVPIAGGVATFAEPGSPFNKVAGLGFAGAPTGAQLDEIERAFATRGADVQVELSHLGDARIGALLTDRGYRLTSFENVLGLALAGGIEPVIAPGIEVRRSGEDEFDAWLDVVAEGFAHPDIQGVPPHEDFPRDVLERAERDFAAVGVVRYIALRDAVPAAGASLRIGEGVAQLAGSATAPAHRRRGIQSALLAARLTDAVAAGCDIAVVTTQPGSKSQENVQRRGFHLLYTRAVLVRGHKAAAL